MKKVFTLLIFSFMYVTLSNASLWPQDTLIHDVFEQSKPSVIRINTYDRFGEPLGQGSGFFISPGEILTCEHVMVGAYSAEVVSDFHYYENVAIFKKDEINDLVLLCISSSGYENYLNLENHEEIQMGQSIITMGYPGSVRILSFDGIVNESEYDGLFGYVQANQSAIAVNGMSGGPVLNLKGNVIGIISFHDSAISIEAIKKFLNEPDNPRQLQVAGYCVLWMRILQGTLNLAKEVPPAIFRIMLEPIFNHGWVKGVVILILVVSLTVWSEKRFPKVSEAYRKRRSKKEVFK